VTGERKPRLLPARLFGVARRSAFGSVGLGVWLLRFQRVNEVDEVLQRFARSETLSNRERAFARSTGFEQRELAFTKADAPAAFSKTIPNEVS
jgi:hypothetical protein